MSLHNGPSTAATQESPLRQAIDAWRRSLGEEAVRADPTELARYAENVSVLDSPIGAIVLPDTVDAVRTMVRIAVQAGVSISPFSRGRNWGLGSRLPVVPGSAVADLSRMASLRRLDLEHGYAIIEPGVTQGQLSELLTEHGGRWIVDVTGAPRGTSIVGNLLDRGVGYLSLRRDLLLGLEAVLGDGRVIRTGAWRFGDSPSAHLHGQGIGPDVGALLPQSNLAVVTAAIIALRPAPVRPVPIVCRLLSRHGLGQLVDVLRTLREQETFTSIVHIANRARSDGIMLPALGIRLTAAQAERHTLARDGYPAAGAAGEWSAVLAVSGSQLERAVRIHTIRHALRRVASVQVISPRLLRALAIAGRSVPRLQRFKLLSQAIEPLQGLASGCPTDEVIASMLFPLGGGDFLNTLDPDGTSAGVLLCLYVLPFTGADAENVARLVDDIGARHGFLGHITLNGITPKLLEAVVSISFNRSNPEEVEAAHACDAAMHDAFAAAGCIPYRLGVQHQHRARTPGDYWATVEAIKQALDPARIIAPGKYGP